MEDLLKIAIEGETFDYTEMYPTYAQTALEEGNEPAVKKFLEQIEESKEHSKTFEEKLLKISKVFKGLENVEKQHAQGYIDALNNLKK